MEATIQNVLYVFITVMLPLLLRFVWQLISVKIADSRYAAALNDVYSAVVFVNQTYVDALKEKECFDKEAQAYALEKAKNAALDLMSDSTFNWLEKTIGNLDDWLTVQIEAAVRRAKPVKEAA